MSEMRLTLLSWHGGYDYKRSLFLPHPRPTASGIDEEKILPFRFFWPVKLCFLADGSFSSVLYGERGFLNL